jgi:hypothetical protein
MREMWEKAWFLRAKAGGWKNGLKRQKAGDAARRSIQAD